MPAMALQIAPRRVTNDPVALMGQSLLKDIQVHLAEATFFQREDLLHLPTFSHVSTITRYRYVCAAVEYLIRTRKLAPRSRSDLCLAERKGQYEDQGDLIDRYRPTVKRLLGDAPEQITVMALVDRWTRTDQHLTVNTKRVIIRETLRHMAREGALVPDGYGFKKAKAKKA